VTFSPKIQPICLAKRGDDDAYFEGKVAGWGATEKRYSNSFHAKIVFCNDFLQV